MDDGLTPSERREKIMELGTQYARLSAQALRLAAEVNTLAQNPTDENKRKIVDRIYLIRKVKAALEDVNRLLERLGARAQIIVERTPEGLSLTEPLTYNDATIVPGRSSRRRNR